MVIVLISSLQCIIPAHDGEACRKPVLIKKCVLTTDQAAYVRAHIARHDSFPGETWGKTRAPQHLIDRYGWMPPSSMPPQSDGDVSGDENHPPAGGRSSGPDSGARRKALSLNALKEASQNLNVQRSSVSRSALKEVSNVREGETAFDRWMQTERGKVSIAEAFYKAVNHPDFPTVASAPATAPIASALTAAASNGVYTPTPATAGTAALTASTTPTSARTFAATSTSAASTSAATTVGKKRTRVSELTRHATLFDDGSIEIFSSDDDEARPAKKQRRDRRLDVRLDPHDVAALRKLHRRILDYQRAGAALAEEVAQYTQKAVERELYYGSESD